MRSLSESQIYCPRDDGRRKFHPALDILGRDYERAYSSAMMKAIGKAKNIRRKKEWGNAKTTTELGVIPYDCTFSSIGKDKYCKLFFRYFMPR